eukprot:1626659-Pyramimonas_sp.AAC.1
MRNVIGQPSYDYDKLEARAVLGNEPEPTAVPSTPGQPSGAQTPLQQGNLPVPAGPMTIVSGNPTLEVEDSDGCGLCEGEATILVMDVNGEDEEVGFDPDSPDAHPSAQEPIMPGA